MSPQTPQPNTKRYWGDEKNLDSIYAIYLKKISYSFNNDISLSSNEYGKSKSRDFSRVHDDDGRSTNSASSSDLTKPIRGTLIRHNESLFEDVNQKAQLDDTPREKKKFFHKYRRRSCSMDKYSVDKQTQKGATCEETAMRFSSDRRESSKSKLNSSTNYDELDSSRRNVEPKDTLTGSYMTIVDAHRSNDLDRLSQDVSTQSLQWETRQVRVLQAATLDHAIKFILLINSSTKDISSLDSGNDSQIDTSTLEEERNNVAHIIHVLFCTYRTFTNPYELMLKILDYSDSCRIEQYRFVMHYWMDNYPEDFEYLVDLNDGSSDAANCAPSVYSYNNSITSNDSSNTTKTVATSDSENSARLTGSSRSENDNADKDLSNSTKNQDGRACVPLVTAFLRLTQDEYLKDKAMKLDELRRTSILDRGSSKRTKHHSSGSRTSAILDFDSRFVAQQLTAIDLENFLDIKPYSLLEGTKSDKQVQRMVKNFNLLSRHVVITILKSHTPHVVTTHWIAIAINLRKTKNFNSLKAIIAGLTNESIYRLKQTVWTKLDKTSLTNFKLMASVVDDVNNQTVLRQTQLIVEGTAKMSIEDDSFGTVPYLGTFLTDLTMIDARYQSFVPSPRDETSKLKLINFEKCAKQFEILTQVQLLQKNVLASLQAIQRRNHFDGQTTVNKLKIESRQSNLVMRARPAIPQVSRLFENWFYDPAVTLTTDKQW